MHRTVKQPSDESNTPALQHSSTPAVRSVLKAGKDLLDLAGVAESRIKAELILSRALKCHRLELPLQQNRELTEGQAEQVAARIERVIAGEPIQYVLGDMDFMGRVFKTDSRALIPRPETETLVEHVMACKDVWLAQAPTVVDVGVGTGCIVVTLALERPNGQYLGIDASADALELACENAAVLGVDEKIKFTQGDLLAGVQACSLDLVVSNPPYVATAEIETLQADIRNHEPRLALDGGPDGMNVISKLVPQAFNWLRPGGWLFLEIGEDQGSRVKSLMKKNGFAEVDIRKDLGARDRVACGRKCNVR
jgi:release factor glutamine methyltransferase